MPAMTVVGFLRSLTARLFSVVLSVRICLQVPGEDQILPAALSAGGACFSRSGAQAPARAKDAIIHILQNNSIAQFNFLALRLQSARRPGYYSRPRDWGAFPKKLPAALWGPKSSNVYTKYP